MLLDTKADKQELEAMLAYVQNKFSGKESALPQVHTPKPLPPEPEYAPRTLLISFVKVMYSSKKSWNSACWWR